MRLKKCKRCNERADLVKIENQWMIECRSYCTRVFDENKEETIKKWVSL